MASQRSALRWELCAFALACAAVLGCRATGAAPSPDAAADDASVGGALDLASPDDTADLPPPGPGYYETVAPILAHRCWGCHVEGGIGPFPLITFDQVSAKAAEVEAAMASRTMPPWLADDSGSCRKLAGSAWLAEDEIGAVSSWIAGGKAMGDPAHAPAPAEPPPPLVAPDLTVDIGVEYRPTEGLLDETRCFLVDPKLATDRYITAFQVKPGLGRMVHHVMAYALDDQAAAQRAQELDADTPGPGYRCRSTALEFPVRVASAWVPGSQPTRFPDGTGIKLRAGLPLVIQVHYNTASGTGVDRTSIAFQLADSVKSEGLIYPYGHIYFQLPPGVAEVTTGRTFRVKAPLWVAAASPHMHRLGRQLHVSVSHDGKEECLLDVPHYSFDWQRLFFFEEAAHLVPGDRLKLSCTYDTTSRTEPIDSGEDNQDEMCVTMLYVWSG